MTNKVETSPIYANYQRAEQAVWRNMKKRIYKTSVDPIFNSENNQFIYRNNLRDGKKEFWLIDVEANTKQVAFNVEKVAENLNKFLEKPLEADSLDLTLISFCGSEVIFAYKDKEYKLNLTDLAITLQKNESKEQLENVSPDGKFQIFAKEYNLYLRNLRTKEERQITYDGVEDFEYCYDLSSPEITKKGVFEIVKYYDHPWSSDSNTLCFSRIDMRMASKITFVQAMPSDSLLPKAKSWQRSLAINNRSLIEIFLLDVNSMKITKVNKEQLLDICGMNLWLEKNNYLYYLDVKQGFKRYILKEYNYAEKTTKDIIDESSKEYIDPENMIVKILENSNEIIWGSLRDGYCNLYLYDTQKAELKNKITDKEFFVTEIVHCDEEKRKLYFIACGGREDDHNPYLHYLYKVDLDGNNLQLLTPDKGDHNIKFSPNFDYIIDNYNLPDFGWITKLRDKDGRELMLLEESDLKDLEKTGFVMPEVFEATACDEQTKIYGLIHRPSNFDPNKKYPVIDNCYTGGHGYIHTSLDCLWRDDSQALAELGFIVIQVDGRGRNKRNRKFSLHSYKNFKDSGLPDHVYAIKQLARKYSYLDLDRVGITGASHGGFDTANALFNYGDFYKVGVAVSGVYDWSNHCYWYSQIYLGEYDEKLYKEQSPISHCHKLEGKLYIIHGELDPIVLPTQATRLAAKLIEYNKDFDILIVPNADHNCLWISYVHRKKWDYFVTHLLGEIPPKEYPI
ncbi:MAG: DPP IV N-terminal domain-containing protein [Candidatus Delongbacteria bacterium]|nr:DPP IV N-terminal domain-containing protein [Candidatus Delongbacteria bacterium]MBN2836404.1 DPP IV N-terminal domain-containing protein [Candidatus Delongbacteria bacterium]